MEFWLCAVIGILIIVILLLTVKVFLLQKSTDEIREEFALRLTADTNTLIAISSRDSHMRKLAKEINIELNKLKKDRHRFQQGDLELKDAVTNISHDLRTPLTAIFGYLDLLEKEKNTGEARRYIRIIRERTEAMKQLTEELFRYSMLTTASDSTPAEQLILNRLLEESISAYYGALKQNRITPRIDLPEAEVKRILNRNACSRIFGNLLSNAIKYSDGDLDITLRENGEIIFSNHTAQLDEVQAGRLFDRFYTVDTASAGSTGLGLSIARTLTEQMGGTIEADYKDHILSVHIFFPAADMSRGSES